MDRSVLHDALVATSNKRGLKDALAVFGNVEQSPVMEKLWAAYQKKFSYAAEIPQEEIMKSVRELYVEC